MMNAPGGIILTPGHAPWCHVQSFGDGRKWHDAQPCDCGGGFGDRHPPHRYEPGSRQEQNLAGYPWVACEKCGVIEHMTFIGYDNKDPATVRFCFSCQLWHDKLERRDDPGFVVVNGRQYAFDAEHPYVEERKYGGQPSFLGFAGQRFEIQLFSGRRIVTNNLWCGGDVPLIWRSSFPDNASFVSRYGKLVKWESPFKRKVEYVMGATAARQGAKWSDNPFGTHHLISDPSTPRKLMSMGWDWGFSDAEKELHIGRARVHAELANNRIFLGNRVGKAAGGNAEPDGR